MGCITLAYCLTAIRVYLNHLPLVSCYHYTIIIVNCKGLSIVILKFFSYLL